MYTLLQDLIGNIARKISETIGIELKFLQLHCNALILGENLSHIKIPQMPHNFLHTFNLILAKGMAVIKHDFQNMW